MWIDVTTIGDLLDRQAERTPDSDALVFPELRMTYRQLAEASDAVARSLIGLRVQGGDHVGILMPNRLEFVLGLFAIAKVGAVAVPINARFKTHELSQIIDHADVRSALDQRRRTRARRTTRRCSRSSASPRGCRSSTSTRPGTSSWTPGAT